MQQKKTKPVIIPSKVSLTEGIGRRVLKEMLSFPNIKYIYVTEIEIEIMWHQDRNR